MRVIICVYIMIVDKSFLKLTFSKFYFIFKICIKRKKCIRTNEQSLYLWLFILWLIKNKKKFKNDTGNSQYYDICNMLTSLRRTINSWY